MAELNDLLITQKLNLKGDMNIRVVSKESVNSNSTTFTFEKYSNGVKSIHAANSSATASAFDFNIPSGYEAISSQQVYAGGLNSQYNSTTAGVYKTRYVGMTSNHIYVYASGYTGLWIKFYYI